MKFRPLRAAAAVAITGLLIVQPGVHFGSPTTAHAFSYNSLNKIQKRILSGFAEYELNPQSAAQSDAQARNYSPRGSDSCAVNLGDNVKVNQNCLNISDPDLQGRGQAQNETSDRHRP